MVLLIMGVEGTGICQSKAANGYLQNKPRPEKSHRQYHDSIDENLHIKACCTPFSEFRGDDWVFILIREASSCTR